MAYEKLQLLVSAIGHRIYLTSILKNGTMSSSKRDLTQEVIRAAAEWFIITKKEEVEFKGHGKLVWIKEEEDE